MNIKKAILAYQIQDLAQLQIEPDKKILGIELPMLEKEMHKLKNFVENMKEAIKGYNSEKRTLGLLTINPKAHSSIRFMNGNQSIVYGAIKSGLNFYYAYPMTPATPVMMELGSMMLDRNNKHKVIELENEISDGNILLNQSKIKKTNSSPLKCHQRLSVTEIEDIIQKEEDNQVKNLIKIFKKTHEDADEFKQKMTSVAANKKLNFQDQLFQKMDDTHKDEVLRICYLIFF